ncbi:protein of unknown function [Taphrina deformans PYCC 5710]|uniref:Uncharacterized protein n=1 Tax=Taphrina deformans (strain PYCC 5710 / ATCC 11124 / CBS 356.35 / IMI 108563 / JCM 9778 / NBRC 8474) TaxID=1097556 RepID=R4XFU6_TAPDE|nr:protein of unknown function [Taphrina deformans PYCC 5710]|eukprot:CCG84615.1 protein of unknown function [Taphrina deformans PYCC 5710]
MIGNLNAFDPRTTLSANSPYNAIDNYATAVSTKFRLEIEQYHSMYSFNKAVASLNQYTNAHLSAFYFDTLKDRLYTDALDSPSRLSAQKTFHLQPQLTGKAQHIYASDWHATRLQYVDHDQLQSWEPLMQLRDTVNKSLEVARSQKLITASLQASLRLSLPKSLTLPVPASELANLFIVSDVQVDQSGKELSVSVEKASGDKCPRCWTYTSQQPESLCARCESVLS